MIRQPKRPQTRLGAPKEVPQARFALGTRPSSLRGKPPTFDPNKNTRDYGMKTPPAVAIQPGNPMP